MDIRPSVASGAKRLQNWQRRLRCKCVVDDSGSMAFEEGGERIEDMKAVLGRTADAATLFDTDGIVVRYSTLPNAAVP